MAIPNNERGTALDAWLVANPRRRVRAVQNVNGVISLRSLDGQPIPTSQDMQPYHDAEKAAVAPRFAPRRGFTHGAVKVPWTEPDCVRVAEVQAIVDAGLLGDGQKLILTFSNGSTVEITDVAAWNTFSVAFHTAAAASFISDA